MEIQLGYMPQVLLLALARVGGVIALTPFWGGSEMSGRVKMAAALAVTLVMLPVLPPEWTAAARAARTMPQLVLATISELLLGIGVALICGAFVALAQMTGVIAGRESSLMMAETIDPASGVSTGILAVMMQMVFITIVLACNGHLVLLKFLAQSFRSAPHSMAWMSGGNLRAMVAALGSGIFETGLRFALPLLCVALVSSVCLGLIARLAPDFNILFLSLPIRILVGLSMFGLVLRFSAGSFEKVVEQMLFYCRGILL